MSDERYEYEEEIRATAEMEREAFELAEAEKEAAKAEKSTPERIDYDQLKRDFKDNVLGDGRRLIESGMNRILFDPFRGWFRFNCTRWIKDRERHHLKIAMEVADDYERQAEYYKAKLIEATASGAETDVKKGLAAQFKAWSSRASSIKDTTRAKRILEVASSGPDSLGISGTEWNQHPHLFACKNTLIDLRTGKAVEPGPGQFLNQASGVEWKGLNHACEEWIEFLDAVFEGNQELINYVQKLAGYWLSGELTHQDFYCLWGPRGRNGKGVLFRTIRAIMGDYYTTIPAALLMDSKEIQKADGPSTTLLDLQWRRLACASESNKRAKFSDDAIKILTGGDPLRVRGLYSSELVDVIPAFKLLFATNRIPSVDGGDQAFRVRLRVIPFNCHFLPGVDPDPEKKIYPMDHELEKRLHTPDSLSGILAWAARGAVEYYRTMDLTPPALVQDLTDQHMKDNDLIGKFLERCITITDASTPTRENKIQMKYLFAGFKQWCMEEENIGEKFVPNQQNFGTELKQRQDLGIQRVSPMNVTYYNIRPKEDALDFFPADV